MILTRIAVLAAVLLALSALPANAIINCNQQGCSSEGFKNPPGQRHAAKSNKRMGKARIEDGARYLPHPPGCPRIAFCACGASVEIFGKAIRSLWPARAWYKFPRTSPGYKMVAVRAHHVFVLISHVGGNEWLVRDYNSGGHKSREHVRSIAGYKIVNPNGGLAMN